MRNVKIIIPTLLVFFPLIVSASTYGENFLTGGSCTDSSHYNASTDCTYAFNGNVGPGNEWNNNTSENPSWIKYDVGNGNSFAPDKISIVGGTTNGINENQIKDFIFQVSNDNSNWINVSTTIAQNVSFANWQDFTFTATTTKYRYFRLYITSNYIPDNSFGLTEWTAYECLDCATGTSTISTSTTAMLDSYVMYLFDILIICAVAWIVIWISK